MVKSAYIHIPFCKSKCNYCSFVSYPDLDLKERYLSALKKEIDFYYEKENLSTLYLGGGTPSILSVEDIDSIVNLFSFDTAPEITVELNPENLDEAYFKGLKGAGVNRISIGCQTFNDEILKYIARRHDSSQVKNAVKAAQNCGFDNINLDFIYGLPSQSPDDFVSDLNIAVSLGVQHISLYGLKIEKGCYFYTHKPENLPDEDMQADMYLKAIEILEPFGFKHYEISNFAKNDFSSRHNLNYWDNNYYYGFGMAAHGYVNDKRYANSKNFENYFENPFRHAEEHVVSLQEKLEEEIFLGFRKMDGLDINNINHKFGINFENKYSDILAKYTEYGYLLKTLSGYKLSNEGILISNTILSEFLN